MLNFTQQRQQHDQSTVQTGLLKRLIYGHKKRPLKKSLFLMVTGNNALRYFFFSIFFDRAFPDVFCSPVPLYRRNTRRSSNPIPNSECSLLTACFISVRFTGETGVRRALRKHSARFSVPTLFFSGHHLAVPSLLPIVQLLSGTVLFSPDILPG